MTILVSNPRQLRIKVQKMQSTGPNNLHVISDFDRTLTKPVVAGKIVASSYSRIRDGNYLTRGFSEESSRLFNIYHSIEIDPTISLEEKKQKMQEWWEANWKLMLEHGMHFSVVKKVARDKSIQLRDKTDLFFKTLNERKIPLLIFSSGLGDIIKEFLKVQNLFNENVHLVANEFIFNDAGEVIGFSKPMITIFSKNELQLNNKEYKEDIKNRKNVILLGDSLGDLDMASGVEHDQIITIGFFDEFKAELKNELLEQYKEAFDVVLTENSDFSYVNELVDKIIERE